MIVFSHCCKGCQKRAVGCHGTCEVYLTAKVEHEAKVEKDKAERKVQNDATNFRKESIEKTMRSVRDRKHRK